MTYTWAEVRLAKWDASARSGFGMLTVYCHMPDSNPSHILHYSPCVNCEKLPMARANIKRKLARLKNSARRKLDILTAYRYVTFCIKSALRESTFGAHCL